MVIRFLLLSCIAVTAYGKFMLYICIMYMYINSNKLHGHENLHDFSVFLAFSTSKNNYTGLVNLYDFLKIFWVGGHLYR